MTIKSILFGLLVLSLISCKKETEAPQPDQQSLSQVEDNSDLKSEGDQANTDVTDALDNFKSINGRIARKVICGCEIDSVGEKTIRLRYDGVTPCGSPSRTRAGTITFELIEKERWAMQGAVIRITLANYKVTKLSNSKSWTFNGTKYLTNVKGYGAYLQYLAGTDSLIFRERARDMNVVVNDGSQITYNIARTSSWKNIFYPNRSVTQFASEGDTTINGLEKTDTWGINRFGNNFTSQYLSRFTSDSYCKFYAPRSGTIQHKSNGNVLTIYMGVNETGQADTRDCAYGWKINWNLSSGASGEKIFSY